MQLDNEAKLQIDRENQVVNKDYIDFTMDLRHDRGKIFVGSCEDAKKRPDTWISTERAHEFKPSLVFAMRD